MDTVGTVARLGLAALWLVAGAVKLADPAQTYVSVRGYELLPDAAVGVVATALPIVEIVLGVLLLAGVATRAAALVSLATLLVFIAAIAQAWARGLSIDCGCFGGGGPVEPGQTAYLREIAVDVLFLLPAGWLVVRPVTRWTLSGWMRGGQGTPHDEPEHGTDKLDTQV